MYFRFSIALCLGLFLWVGSAHADRRVSPKCPSQTKAAVKNGWACVHKKTNKRHGPFQMNFDDGSSLRGEWKQGRRHGTWTYRTGAGDSFAELDYQNGTGKHVAFSGFGRIRETGAYRLGQRDGEWLFFDEDQRLKATAKYKRGSLKVVKTWRAPLAKGRFPSQC